MRLVTFECLYVFIDSFCFLPGNAVTALGHFLPFKLILAQRQIWGGKRTFVIQHLRVDGS